MIEFGSELRLLHNRCYYKCDSRGRRAQGKSLGIEEPFTPAVADVAIALSGGCDGDVAANAGRVRDELAREEGRFRATLAAGEKVLNDSLEVPNPFMTESTRLNCKTRSLCACPHLASARKGGHVDGSSTDELGGPMSAEGRAGDVGTRRTQDLGSGSWSAEQAKSASRSWWGVRIEAVVPTGIALPAEGRGRRRRRRAGGARRPGVPAVRLLRLPAGADGGDRGRARRGRRRRRLRGGHAGAAATVQGRRQGAPGGL